MSFYPPPVSEKFHAPQNAGRIKNASAFGARATFVCGAVLRFTLRIDKSPARIADAKFQTSGCGFAVAAAEILAQEIKDKKLAELHGLEESALIEKLESALGKFPAEKKHCLKLAAETLQQAFADFRAKQLKEWNGEKALICTCFGVSEETIENLVLKESLRTVEEVTNACNAGGGCGSCQPLIQEIIDSQESGEIF